MDETRFIECANLFFADNTKRNFESHANFFFFSPFDFDFEGEEEEEEEEEDEASRKMLAKLLKAGKKRNSAFTF